MPLDCIEHETGTSPAWSVIWLHGLGADGHDFAPIVPQLVRRDWPALRFVFPHAPVRKVTINNHMAMRAWYDIVDADLDTRADETGVAESVAQVEALIAREATRGVPRGRVLLAGFSQGGAVTLAAGLRSAEPLAGLVALSTYVPSANKARSVLAEARVRAPVFFGHGSQDPVVPFQAGQGSAALLRELGFDVDWHAYPMPHSVCAEEISDLGDWMSRRFSAG
ncbi:dienelactone hydrolase family protein [Luteimonas sp. MC1572]|uniref:alpha/beta hydrolase n=1 Tax=Luteimonas sp. MC1572 TaxID=2799325 RepID=UPI0018F103F9|nr:dienelactone hydrolase family protein [Luteimonas sp. MC1572]MBJ6981644.1 dienelactone hydrolase family protein [Luteimonas sp. MC1572]QQO02938.1 dienelactone hydrolase family protein [Luteimonas sp. MC1572]